jgi:hypothetical protein
MKAPTVAKPVVDVVAMVAETSVVAVVAMQLWQQ